MAVEEKEGADFSFGLALSISANALAL